MIPQQLHDRIADVAAGTASGALVFGMTIGQINQYLQAGAFLVAIISGCFAIRYYYLRSKS